MDPSTLPAEYQQYVRRQSPRPRGWDGVVGNARAVEMIQEAITAGRIQERAPAHMLLFSSPGMGKSTFAEIIAGEIGGGIVSTTASTLETPMDVLLILRRLNEMREATGRPSTLFLDEAHMLIGSSRGRQSVDVESLFPLLEDFFWPNNLQGRPYTYEGQTWTVKSDRYLVWPFTCLAATTEPGNLPQALLRRFLVHIELEQYTENDIAQIMLGSAARMGWDIQAEAAVELSKYSRRNPGRAYQLLTSARNRALATSRSTIGVGVASEVVERLQLYPLGLTEKDVRVLQILADRMPRGVGVAEICRGLGVSTSQYTGMIEPFLTLLGMVETLSRRVIKPAGLAYLAQLGRVDATRPEVRAAMAS